ncbi:MAG: TonB-dependent receptor [Halieaceae bacterium]|nr:TonB-dependent receptor [Halieaceae bacterium]MCP5148688.1 TonB-dependent receptor [Pseudomonadales bacterium]MCP5166306.1 TonB-dependent receptor [Pseudomonadales bacterium]
MNIRVPRALGALCLGSAAVAAQGQATLEEVVVTAQKRTESLQDVSIAISAFSEKELRNLSISNLENLTQSVSGVELFDERGSGQPTWVIRGVGLADFNANNTPTAAIYFDEFYLTSNVMGGIGMYDIARVEVLKGPQGGLYGRNTSGGAVRVLSVRPDLEQDFNGYIQGSYGRWDRAIAEGAAGGKITDKLAYRVAGMTDQNGGWQDTLATPGDDDYGDRNFSSGRAQLLFQPTDKLEFLLKVDGGEDKSETTLAYSRALFDPSGSGDYCASAYAGTLNQKDCVTLANITSFYALTPGDAGPLASSQQRDGSVVLSNPINKLDNSWGGANLQVNWDLDFAMLTSISGYLDYDNKQVFDYDGSPLVLFEEDGKAELTVWSQEFRLVSQGDGPLNWLAGAAYGEDEDKEHRFGNTLDNLFVFPSLTERGFTQENEYWSVYGQLEYDLDDEWTAHGSLRYSDENKKYKNGFTQDLIDGFYYYQDVNKSYELQENWSGHAGMDWAPSDDLMLYGRITRGYKTGGFPGGFAFTPEELNPYDEETVWSYELGFKSTWLANTLKLNGAAFYYDYQDVQGYTQRLSEETGTVVSALGNLGDAEHIGAELDMEWLPGMLPGLSLQASVAWLSAEYKSNDFALDPADVAVDLDGYTRPYAPEWSAYLQARYEWQLSSSLGAGMQLNYSWRDDIYGEEMAITPLSYAAYNVNSYGILNARAWVGSMDGQWQVALIGKNLTESEYWTSGTGDDLGSFVSTPGQRMSYAVEATYSW